MRSRAIGKYFYTEYEENHLASLLWSVALIIFVYNMLLYLYFINFGEYRGKPFWQSLTKFKVKLFHKMVITLKNEKNGRIFYNKIFKSVYNCLNSVRV